MSQRIEAPTEADVDRIARQLIHASDLTKSIVGEELSGQESDLNLIQRIVDSRQLEREATYCSLLPCCASLGPTYPDWTVVMPSKSHRSRSAHRQVPPLANLRCH